MTEVDPKAIKCLDLGFVRLVDHMGDDQRVVDSARVSYQKGTTIVQDNRNLIRYMLHNGHLTPFEKIVFELHIKTPMFIGEQFLRHRIGSFNKISGRYSEMKDEFYVPSPVRKQSSTNKQGSADEKVLLVDYTVMEEGLRPLNDPPYATEFIEGSHSRSYYDYEVLLKHGVAKELARGVLPANLYTEFYWTVNLRSLSNFLQLRLDPHAQLEIQIYAQAIYDLIKNNCDLNLCLEAFQDYILDDPKLSKYEFTIISQLIDDLAERSNTSESELKELLQKLIQDNPDMSKREKKESKLINRLCSMDNFNDRQLELNLSEKNTTST